MKLSSIAGAFGAAGILSAFGYVSLRVHWNHFGIAAPNGVNAERYAAETYAIVLVTAQWLAWRLLLAAVPVAAAYALWRVISRRRPQSAERFKSLFRTCTPWLLLVLLLTTQFAILRAVPSTECSDIALGVLSARAGCCNAPPGAETTFYVAVLATIAAFALTASEQLTALQKIVRILALIIAIQLPLVYGATLDPALYRVVRISTSDGPHVGLLVLETSDMVELWDASGGNGRMLLFQKSDVKSIESGPFADLRSAIRTIGSDGRPDGFQRFCNTLLSRRE